MPEISGEKGMSTRERAMDAFIATLAGPAFSRDDVREEAKHIVAGTGVYARTGPLQLDTAGEVFFYEQDHYYLSNFSAFRVEWKRITFDTSEAAYHWERFAGAPTYQRVVRASRSAHDAFRFAQDMKSFQRADWDDVKVGIMRDILRAKADQHEYVRRKLLQTGERVLIENSWRDPFWGWGPKRDGKNMLGVLWMEVRAELRAGAKA
jgi:ribA/ribD-fused uncharacterized protein